ncbi:hypothetical protein D7030_05740 [Flavobacteriaceae bacterium AU392]|nr:hypothetical protein D1817_02680 [Flavobacteriaceae bacterium]RKM84635.1 hypothetical protein D7030_05740 [Flavobacteriaceae bacterium AU392]
MEIVKNLHSYWAYLVLLILVITAVNSLIKVSGGKEYGAKDFRLALFTLIVTHIQLLIALILYVTSPLLSAFGELGMGGVMKNSAIRLLLIEHPLINIIAIALITIGYSKHKKKLTSASKFKMIAIFYTIALLLFLSRIPWTNWFN